MIDAKEQYQIFHTHLKGFEPVLEKYGYSFSKMDHEQKTGLSYESNDYEYLNTAKALKLHLSVSVVTGAQTTATVIGFIMFGPKREFFSLNEYQESRKPVQIKTSIPGGEDVNLGIEHFFRDLHTAVETYLNDQITGRAFENHSDNLMNSYYSHGAVHNMQKQVINEAIAKREIEAKTSFLGRIVKLFKS